MRERASQPLWCPHGFRRTISSSAVGRIGTLAAATERPWSRFRGSDQYGIGEGWMCTPIHPPSGGRSGPAIPCGKAIGHLGRARPGLGGLGCGPSHRGYPGLAR